MLKNMAKSYWAILLVAILVVKGTDALIHDLTLNQDTRGIFKIESFGFAKDGHITISLSEFKVSVGDKTLEGEATSEFGTFGFYIRVSSTEVYSLDKSKCLIKDSASNTEIKLPITFVGESGNKNKFTVERDIQEAGLYTIYFVSCPTEKYAEATLKISFKSHIELYNLDGATRDYLSVGKSALPSLFFVIFLIHLVICGAWGRIVKRNWATTNKLHILMTALLVIKTLTLLWQSLEYRELKVSGNSGGWGVIYYIFSFLRYMMLFTVILLIGTGWAFLKPFLNDREKKMFMFVIPLQLFANIALIIVDESSPGSQEWVTWKDIFGLVDLICCALIIIPILWSIKHLRQAAQSDGKAAKSLKMLQLFRSFYLMVIAYVYFSRIIIALLDPVIPYNAAWVAPLLNEIAALTLYVTTGFWFRPGDDNPYFKLATSEEEDVAAVAMEKMETADADD